MQASSSFKVHCMNAVCYGTYRMTEMNDKLSKQHSMFAMQWGGNYDVINLQDLFTMKVKALFYAPAALLLLLQFC